VCRSVDANSYGWRAALLEEGGNCRVVARPDSSDGTIREREIKEGT
jgi:hypothetical protein